MINSVNHITLSVRDLDESFQFYHDILKLKPLAKRKNKSAYFLAGDNWIVLVQAKEPNEVFTSNAHLAFSITLQNFIILSQQIRNSGAKIWQENSSPGESLYFLDPSGNKLEIHCGDWKSRIQWLKENPTDEVELYE